ncbi:MAG: hypothetical protein A2298_05210 [Gammaproteobacteria bacterium RIFOXYB2_FULL_38_6]|nr:MAG: hypothetical protein A2298_05210 [Gammaproteobacteria bacterium RIFOXYB2_FULL_38_6]
MSFDIYNLIGLLGVFFVLLAYFLLQTNKVTSKDLSFSIYNLLGSAGIVTSLIKHWNLSAFIVEVFWTAITLHAVYKLIRK